MWGDPTANGSFVFLGFRRMLFLCGFSMIGRRVLRLLSCGVRRAGRISVQAIAGHIQIHIEGIVLDLPPGHLLALERGIAHDVEALEDSAFLLTIAWPEDGTKA